MIDLAPEILNDWTSASSREWLETNGIGGYASGTLAGANSRRYHGLLVAATRPPLGRLVLLSKFEETAVIDGERFDLSSNRFPGTIHPQGFRFLKGFRLDPFPVWTYHVNGIEVEKSIFMPNGETTTVCRWRVVAGGSANVTRCEIELRPLLAFRDHHHLRREDATVNGAFETGGGIVSVKPYADMPALRLAHNAGSVEPSGHWYRNIEYAIEEERGFDFTEDLFQPFVLKFDLSAPATVIASTEVRAADEAAELEAKERDRRAMLVQRSAASDDLSRQLVLAADQFIVDRGRGKTVIAGYPWFSDWGRDTMIALPGLTLATSRPETAKSILSEFAQHISEGMLPNRFPDGGETPEYNTVDATLWFFEAIGAYLEKTGDERFVREELYTKLVDIIDWHVRGTRYGIRVDTDGLLNAGEPGVQLTWMDAKVGDWVVTPRTGKAVEIQALWYNALCIMAELARLFDDTRAATYHQMAKTARRSFNEKFWYEDGEYLFDCIDGEKKDASLRPNQVFAVSLRHSILTQERSKQVVKRIETELLTPVGLRSLAPTDANYVPKYLGSSRNRDAAYHQGTVWAWLIGPFVDAYRKTNASRQADKMTSQIRKAIETQLIQAAVGQVSEIFDADLPHAPRGCPAQAWSVAEVLRVYHR